jgi:hypothetical protein
VLKKNIIVEKLLSFERSQELCWRPLYQNPFYTFIKTLDENLKNFPQNNTKHTPKKVHFLT